MSWIVDTVVKYKFKGSKGNTNINIALGKPKKKKL